MNSIFLPRWVKITLFVLAGLVVGYLLFAYLWKVPVPDTPPRTDAEKERLRFERDSLLTAAALKDKRQRVQDSVNRLNAAASNESTRSYNQSVTSHKTENEAYLSLPAARRYTVDVRTIQQHRPKPCKFCDSTLAED